MKFLGLLFLAGLLIFWPSTVKAEDFQLPRPGRGWQFPRDHGAHPEFKTEWWYYSGHLKSTEGRAFGYQLTFFRAALKKPDPKARSAWALDTVYFAHLALTDPEGRTFIFREKAGRGALGLSGVAAGRLKVWVGEWAAKMEGEKHLLSAKDEGLELNLTLTSLKPPALHGEGGFSRKAAQGESASYYYSLTRLNTQGKLVMDGKALEVSGASWMDHEFFTSPMAAGQVGWDWFALQLNDGWEVMLYLLRHQDGRVDPASSGTLVDPEGRARHLTLADFQVKNTATWKSPRSGAAYPSGWEITIPGAGCRLTLVPTLADQEIRAGGLANLTYWEGEVKITGTRNGQPVAGRGYTELTGYAGGLGGKF